jgi:hypothetical protein
MPGGSVVPWLAAALILGLLSRANAHAVLPTAAVVALAALGYLARRRSVTP